MSQKSQRVLIQLDALLDTRVGTAYRMGAKDIDWVSYFDRTHSKVWEFFGLEEEAFKQTYLKRNLETLELSMATELYRQLSYVMRNKLVLATGSPLHERPEIVINYWPYNLSSATVELFKQAVVETLSDIARMRVNAVYVAPERLTPKYLKDNYTDYVLYDLSEWLELAGPHFADCPIPDVAVCYPATLNVEDVTKYAPQTPDDDPFANIALMTSLVIKLEAISPRLLSVDPALLWRDDPQP